MLSDFGIKDQYVASMRGVILTVNPRLRIVDITHQIPKYNIRIASFILAQSASTFPRGTVHMAVVDPGVGTKRLPIIIQTKNYQFVGPDNGLLAAAVEQDKVVRIHKIEMKIQKFGPVLKDFMKIEQMAPQFQDKRVSAEVTAIDSFGNVVTNIPGSEIVKHLKEGERILVKFGRSELNVPFMQTYGDVREGEILSLVGSSTFLELGINHGNFAEKFHDVEMGMRVEIEFLGKPA